MTTNLKGMTVMNSMINIISRFSGSVIFQAQIECATDTPRSIQLGLAVKVALKSGANLYGADLSRADLSGANLYGANLYGANLSRADLSRADLSGANLSRANLYGADLYGANLYGANLYGANLYGADLYGADLYGADLSGANLDASPEATLAIKRTRILPEGSLIGWKKCHGGVIVKLRVPEEARRSHAFGRKCRAEFVDVLEVIGSSTGTALSSHDGVTKYKVGERVHPDSFSDDWKVECAPGIHFFISREEAEAY